MKKYTLTLCIAGVLLFSGCATAPELSVKMAEIKPVISQSEHQYDIKAALEKATQAYTSENYTQSASLYSEVLVIEPDNPQARIGLADNYIELGKYDIARQHFQALADHDIEESDSERVQLGLILVDVLGQSHRKPFTRLHDGLEITLDDPRIWNAKGFLHDLEGDWLEAMDAYLMAMKLGGVYAGTLNNMGMSLLRQERYPEALEKFAQALQIKPETELYDNNRRLVLILSGNIKSALDKVDTKRAANIANDAGYILLQNGDYALAESLFKSAVEMSPVHHKQAHENLEKLKTKHQALRDQNDDKTKPEPA